MTAQHVTNYGVCGLCAAVFGFLALFPCTVTGYHICPCPACCVCALQYAMAALSYNEMSSPRWSTPVTFPDANGVPTTRTLGEWVLINSGLFTESYW